MSMVLSVLEGEDVGREIVFDRLPILVGRTEACNVVLYHPSISRRHCRFYQEDGRVFVEDLRSINGTFVNGVPVVLNSMLGPGDIISLGSLKFRFDSLELVERTERTEFSEPQSNGTLSNGTHSNGALNNGAQSNGTHNNSALRSSTLSNGALSHGADELSTLDPLSALKLIHTPAPTPTPSTQKQFSVFWKNLSSAPKDTSRVEKKSAKEDVSEQSLSEKNLLAEILPEEIEEILPKEFWEKATLFEENFAEEKLPEELLAEETLARENLLQQSFARKPYQAALLVGQSFAEENWVKQSFAKEKQHEAIEEVSEEKSLPEENALKQSVSEEALPNKNEVDEKPEGQSVAPEGLLERILLDEQKLLEQISDEQKLLAKQASEAKIFAEDSLALVRQRSSWWLWLQLLGDKTSRHLLKHPFLFTGIGCLLGVLMVLAFSH